MNLNKLKWFVSFFEVSRHHTKFQTPQISTLKDFDVKVQLYRMYPVDISFLKNKNPVSSFCRCAI